MAHACGRRGVAHVLLVSSDARWLELVPEAAPEVILRPVQHLFERRLNRQLTPAERAVLSQRLGTLGGDRLGDVVLDMDAAALAAWLADPAAT